MGCGTRCCGLRPGSSRLGSPGSRAKVSGSAGGLSGLQGGSPFGGLIRNARDLSEAHAFQGNPLPTQPQLPTDVHSGLKPRRAPLAARLSHRLGQGWGGSGEWGGGGLGQDSTAFNERLPSCQGPHSREKTGTRLTEEQGLTSALGFTCRHLAPHPN